MISSYRGQRGNKYTPSTNTVNPYQCRSDDDDDDTSIGYATDDRTEMDSYPDLSRMVEEKDSAKNPLDVPKKSSKTGLTSPSEAESEEGWSENSSLTHSSNHSSQSSSDHTSEGKRRSQILKKICEDNAIISLDTGEDSSTCDSLVYQTATALEALATTAAENRLHYLAKISSVSKIDQHFLSDDNNSSASTFNSQSSDTISQLRRNPSHALFAKKKIHDFHVCNDKEDQDPMLNPKLSSSLNRFEYSKQLSFTNAPKKPNRAPSIASEISTATETETPTTSSSPLGRTSDGDGEGGDDDDDNSENRRRNEALHSQIISPKISEIADTLSREVSRTKEKLKQDKQRREEFDRVQRETERGRQQPQEFHLNQQPQEFHLNLHQKQGQQQPENKDDIPIVAPGVFVPGEDDGRMERRFSHILRLVNAEASSNTMSDLLKPSYHDDDDLVDAEDDLQRDKYGIPKMINPGALQLGRGLSRKFSDDISALDIASIYQPSVSSNVMEQHRSHRQAQSPASPPARHGKIQRSYSFDSRYESPWVSKPTALTTESLIMFTPGTVRELDGKPIMPSRLVSPANTFASPVRRSVFSSLRIPSEHQAQQEQRQSLTDIKVLPNQFPPSTMEKAPREYPYQSEETSSHSKQSSRRSTKSKRKSSSGSPKSQSSKPLEPTQKVQYSPKQLKKQMDLSRRSETTPKVNINIGTTIVVPKIIDTSGSALVLPQGRRTFMSKQQSTPTLGRFHPGIDTNLFKTFQNKFENGKKGALILPQAEENFMVKQPSRRNLAKIEDPSHYPNFPIGMGIIVSQEDEKSKEVKQASPPKPLRPTNSGELKTNLVSPQQSPGEQADDDSAPPQPPCRRPTKEALSARLFKMASFGKGDDIERGTITVGGSQNTRARAAEADSSALLNFYCKHHKTDRRVIMMLIVILGCTLLILGAVAGSLVTVLFYKV